MSFSEYTKISYLPLTEHIISFLENKKSNRNAQLHNDVLQKLITFVPTGKLLRGISVILSYEMCRGKLNKNILNVASALELAHSALLIHDDIMDKDHTRRGMPTISSQYAESIDGKTENSLFYGQAMGMTVGDIAFFLAFELLNKAQQPQLTELFTQELQLVGPAQMYDFHYGQTTEEPTYTDIMEVYRYKTGRYTFALPLMLGSMLAGADTSMISQLEQFGEKLGIVFQIHDDYLGLFGSEDKTGKPVGSDIKENKKTLLRQMLFNAATEPEKKKLQHIFGNSLASKADIEYVQMLYHKYLIIENIQQLQHSNLEDVEGILQTLTIEEKYRKILHGLVKFTVERTL